MLTRFVETILSTAVEELVERLNDLSAFEDCYIGKCLVQNRIIFEKPKLSRALNYCGSRRDRI